MTQKEKQELVKFLSDNLTIKFENAYDGFRAYPSIVVKLDELEICRATNYDLDVTSLDIS